MLLLDKLRCKVREITQHFGFGARFTEGTEELTGRPRLPWKPGRPFGPGAPGSPAKPSLPGSPGSPGYPGGNILNI